jgi:hypothetical protein
VQTYVARFASHTQITAFLQTLSDKGSYRISPFTINGRVVGLLYEAPVSAADVDGVTYFCGLPNYLVQYYSSSSSVPWSTVRDQYWSAAPTLNVVPQACNADFSGPASGSTPSAGTGTKTITAFDPDSLQAFVRRGHADWYVSVVDVPVGSDIGVVGQQQSVAFWTWNKTTNELVVDGSSRYPYDVKLLGAPQATIRGSVLTGMKHATFIVTGTFSTDGSGNAVAYTTLDGKTWGAIKAQKDGNLKPTTSGVGVKGIGLSEDFGFENGLLVTSDCAKKGSSLDCTNPVVKYWRWNSSKNEFLRDH